MTGDYTGGGLWHVGSRGSSVEGGPDIKGRVAPIRNDGSEATRARRGG